MTSDEIRKVVIDALMRIAPEINGSTTKTKSCGEPRVRCSRRDWA